MTYLMRAAEGSERAAFGRAKKIRKVIFDTLQGT
jgi:hypothetical protein